MSCFIRNSRRAIALHRRALNKPFRAIGSPPRTYKREMTFTQMIYLQLKYFYSQLTIMSILISHYMLFHIITHPPTRPLFRINEEIKPFFFYLNTHLFLN